VFRKVSHTVAFVEEIALLSTAKLIKVELLFEVLRGVSTITLLD
jgi:hypothetical protein